jgi:phosphatidylserine/phosphatidylglycerophosphate/cardiolipin synthase-like enzyme
MTTDIVAQYWPLELARDFDAANRSIIMTALSFLPPRTIKNEMFSKLWLAIATASRRGVAVQVALPAPTVAHPATLRNEAAARDLAAIGATTVLVPATNLLHAKTVCIDARLAWVGSGNYTAAAAHHNRECWMRTTDERAVASLAGFHATTFDAGVRAP